MPEAHTAETLYAHRELRDVLFSFLLGTWSLGVCHAGADFVAIP